MSHVFKNHVHVTNPETGESRRFEPGDECPKEFVDLVSPNNFEGEGDKEAEEDNGVKVVNYGSLKTDELADLCADRGLDFEGTREVLIGRLENNVDLYNQIFKFLDEHIGGGPKR